MKDLLIRENNAFFLIKGMQNVQRWNIEILVLKKKQYSDTVAAAAYMLGILHANSTLV